MGLATYRSTKIVQGMLIESISINPDYSAVITDEHGETITVSPDFVLREKPRTGGYYLLNSDGFESFIDKKIFESDFSEL